MTVTGSEPRESLSLGLGHRLALSVQRDRPLRGVFRQGNTAGRRSHRCLAAEVHEPLHAPAAGVDRLDHPCRALHVDAHELVEVPRFRHARGVHDDVLPFHQVSEG